MTKLKEDILAAGVLALAFWGLFFILVIDPGGY